MAAVDTIVTTKIDCNRTQLQPNATGIRSNSTSGFRHALSQLQDLHQSLVLSRQQLRPARASLTPPLSQNVYKYHSQSTIYP
jgi:hypothetical protein